MLLAIKYADREKLDVLAQESGCDFDQFLTQYQPYLQTEQVQQLIQNGFHFGAHSHDHPEYQYLPLTEQLQQTTRSVESISNTFGLGYRLFSFPFTDFGVTRAFFDFVLRDKKVADFTFGCAGLKKDVYPQHIQRIPMEQTRLDGASFLHKTLLFYLLKTPLGRNQLHRS
jgi:peptidoglycan/xylan/chitin deacetylase (PgdA/CDA1 family)